MPLIRYLLRSLGLFAALAAAPLTTAAQAPPAAPGAGAVLYLLPFNADATLEVNALCNLVRAAGDGLPYADVVVVPDTEGKVTSMQQVLADRARPEDSVSREVANAATALEGLKTRPASCMKRRAASAPGARDVHMLWVWVGRDEVMHQRAVQPARGDASLEPAKTFARSTDSRTNAVRVAWDALALDETRPFSAAVSIEPQAPGELRCTSASKEICFAAGTRMKATLALGGSPWIDPKHLAVRGSLICSGPAAARPIEIAAWSRKGAARAEISPPASDEALVLHAEVPLVHEAKCRATAHAMGPSGRKLAVESAEIEVRLRGLLIDRSAPGIRLSGWRRYEGESIGLTEHAALFAVLGERTNRAPLEIHVRRVGLAPPGELLRMGREFVAAARAIHLEGDEQEAEEKARAFVDDLEASRGALIGQDLLEMPSRSSMLNTIGSWGEVTVDVFEIPACTRIHDALAAWVKERNLVSRFPSAWEDRCRTIAQRLRDSMKVEPLAGMLVTAVDPAPRSAIPALRRVPSHVFRGGEPIFAPSVNVPFRRDETYRVHGVDARGTITEAATWRVHSTSAALDLAVGLSGGVGFSRNDSTAIGIHPAGLLSLHFSLGFFRDVLLLRVLPTWSFVQPWGSDEPGALVGKGTLFSMPVTGEVNLPCAMRRLWPMPGQDICPRWSQRLAIGYDPLAQSAFVGLRADARLNAGDVIEFRPGLALQVSPGLFREPKPGDDRRGAALGAQLYLDMNLLDLTRFLD